MAMICKYGGRECDGCQNCIEEEPNIHCPICGSMLDYCDTVYYSREDDEILGCENCIGTKSADKLQENER